MMVASLSASSMSCPSEEAEPSQPMATLTPCSRNLPSGITPEPSRKLLSGQWTTLAPLAAMSFASSSVSQHACAHEVPGRERKPDSARWETAEPLGKCWCAIIACARVSSRCVCPASPCRLRMSAAPRSMAGEELYAVIGPITTWIPSSGRWKRATHSSHRASCFSVFSASLPPGRSRKLPSARIPREPHAQPAACARRFTSSAAEQSGM
mmetsp:Transcript_26946/g.62089  ORF Transcript_26946/g.62089 Transcript_26946/m.62089 type:complete len:210 (-) Transcript_26946:664-1293(-)